MTTDKNKLKLASLFDGSGGFPLAGIFCGIEPVWASEIEPFPIAVTTKNFPKMKHYGDISTIKGDEVEPVDVITFGSPCFVAGTKVYTSEGYKPIEEICVGDKVLTHKGQLQKVVRVGNKKAKTLIIGDGRTDIECTYNHPFYCIDDYDDCGFKMNIVRDKVPKYEYWNPADNMLGKFWCKPGISETTLYMTKNWFRVTKLDKTNTTFKVVYNIEVDIDHSYIADGVVVHNCQDLSVAGKRTGLIGERSGLFHQAVRIIKEMRSRYENKPRYAVWENVTGAFSSNGGADFLCVLRELASVSTTDIQFNRPEKWESSGQIMGETWSIAWRVLDAQFWGVPQRRKRIFLVADFDGWGAPKILFESSRLQRYFEEVWKTWQNFAKSTRGCPYKPSSGLKLFRNHGQTDDYCALPDIADTVCATYGMGGSTKPYVVDMGAGKSNCGISNDLSPTLTTTHGGEPVVGKSSETAKYIENHMQDCRYKLKDNIADTIVARYGTGGNNCPFVLNINPKHKGKCFVKTASGSCVGDIGKYEEKDISRTLNCQTGGSEGCMCDAMIVESKPGKQKKGVCTCINVEREIRKRKYSVDIEKLQQLLCSKKNKMSVRKIADKLDVPVTKVEHWFRQDNSFSIPDADVWFKLKDILGISTNEFDKSIAEFITDDSSYDMRNRIYTGDISPTITCGCGNDLHLTNCPNTYGIVGNIIGRKDENGGNGLGVKKNIEYTLTATDVHGVCSPCELYCMNRPDYLHQADKELCGTMMAAQANDAPIINEPTYCMTKDYHMTHADKELCGCQVASQFCVPPIINDKEKETYNIRFTQDSSKVKRGHCYKCRISTALTCNQPAPEGNHGGVVVVDGSSKEDIQHGIDTLNECAEHQQDFITSENSKMGALCAGTHGSAPHLTKTVCKTGNNYIVRRLVPQECARLQGFPVWWCDDLSTKNPTEKDIEFWRDIFETWRKILGQQTSKTDKQIIKYLQNPYRDSAEYKMWGNGVALPCVLRVLAGIKFWNSTGEKQIKHK